MIENTNTSYMTWKSKLAMIILGIIIVFGIAPHAHEINQWLLSQSVGTATSQFNQNPDTNTIQHAIQDPTNTDVSGLQNQFGVN